MTYGTAEVEQIFTFYVDCIGTIFDLFKTTVLFTWNGIDITLLYVAVMFMLLTLLLAFVQFVRGY